MDEAVDDTRIPYAQAMGLIKVEINARQHARDQLWQKVVSLDGEIAGLRAAEDLLGRIA